MCASFTYQIQHKAAGFTGTEGGIDFVGGIGTTTSRLAAWYAVHKLNFRDVSPGNVNGLGPLFVPAGSYPEQGKPMIYFLKHQTAGFNGNTLGIDFVNGVGTTSCRADAIRAVRDFGCVDATPDYNEAARALVG